MAVGLTSFAHAEGGDRGDFFGQFKKSEAVDKMKTGSIDSKTDARDALKQQKLDAMGRNEQNPALKAAARSSGEKMSALPGVKEITIESKVSAGKEAKATGDIKYSTIVSRYAAAYGIKESLAHAVIRVESNYRENARGSAGEVGLMQIKPATARMMGYSGSAKGLYDPETNIRFGMKYLAMAQDLGGGTTCGTILKYNAGHGATRMNPISKAYCSKVKQVLANN